jgi:hypothetical protein
LRNPLAAIFVSENGFIGCGMLSNNSNRLRDVGVVGHDPHGWVGGE